MERLVRTDTLPTRASLLERVRDLDDAASWKEFFESYFRRVIGIARSRGLNESEAEDVAQEVFKRIAQTIVTLRPSSRPGAFRSWLHQLTRWRAADQLRRRLPIFARPNDTRSDESRDDCTSTIERVPAPMESEEIFQAESRRHLVQALFKRVKGVVSPRQLQIFQMLVIDEEPPAKVAQIYKISLATVYVIRHRVGSKLREEMTRLELPFERNC